MDERERVGWLADKICSAGDYGKDCADTLRNQRDEIDRLREQLATMKHNCEYGVCQKIEMAIAEITMMKEDYVNDCKSLEKRAEIAERALELACAGIVGGDKERAKDWSEHYLAQAKKEVE